MELSRRFRALKLWLSLRYHGLESFRSAIQQDLDHAQRLAAAIRDASALEITGPVELSAVCFRHRVREDASEEVRNRFQPGVDQTHREPRENLSFERGIEGKILPSCLHRESPHQ